MIHFSLFFMLFFATQSIMTRDNEFQKFVTESIAHVGKTFDNKTKTNSITLYQQFQKCPKNDSKCVQKVQTQSNQLWEDNCKALRTLSFIEIPIYLSSALAQDLGCTNLGNQIQRSYAGIAIVPSLVLCTDSIGLFIVSTMAAAALIDAQQKAQNTKG
jgi:hypothetical protein